MRVAVGVWFGCNSPCMGKTRAGRRKPEVVRQIAALYTAGRTSSPDLLEKRRHRLSVERAADSTPPRI